MSHVDHNDAASSAAFILNYPANGALNREQLGNLCRAYLEKSAEVTALREKLREVVGRVDDVILDLDDEERGVPATEAQG